MRTQTIDRRNPPVLPWPVFLPGMPVNPKPVPLPCSISVRRASDVAIKPLAKPVVMLHRLHTSHSPKEAIRPAAELPMAGMSAVTIDGRRLPVFGGLNRVTVKALRKALDIGMFDRLMKISPDGTGAMLRDGDEIDLMQPGEMKVVRPATAS